MHTSEARRLAFKSKLLMLIDSALRAIGSGNVTEEQQQIIKEKLSFVTQREMDKDIELMPVWIRDLIIKLWKS
jgi:hypothetical protein